MHGSREAPFTVHLGERALGRIAHRRLHWATKFRVGSGVDLKCYFLFEIEAADYEYELHFAVITNPREIIAF